MSQFDHIERVVRVFSSHEVAEAAERKAYAAFTIQQRIDITMQLVSWWDANASTLLAESLDVLKQSHVPFLIVGGYAYGGHGISRYTPDLDIWMEQGGDTIAAIVELLGPILSDGALSCAGVPCNTWFVGKEPAQVHFHTAVTDLQFEPAFKRSEPALLYGHSIRILGRADVVANKRGLRRIYDLADLEALGED